MEVDPYFLSHSTFFGAGVGSLILDISNPDYNKLNKVKKTSPEAFFYYFISLKLLHPC